MTELNKAYQPQAIEEHWYQQWKTHGYFSPSGQGEPYCIVLPPPNVTGQLHMGHGFGCTLMDVLTRYARMQGKNTLWQPGTDHAGIATQMVVERKLQQQGISRHEIGREAFLAKIWEWKNESGGHITRQLQRLGASLDWSREHFTMDAPLSQAVTDVFIRLYEEGLIYRGKRLVNWDPVLLTAISDLEVSNEEEEGSLWTIRYPLVGTTTDECILVATTRPETLLGDMAIAVHPEDERYKHYIGQQAMLPLTDRTIPIIADISVDPLFGTGCVKITPAHDFNDYATGQRHGLIPLNILTPNAHLNENVPPAYQGLERFAARQRIVKDLSEQGLIEKIEKHRLKIPRGDRSGAIIEPYLTDQWFVKSRELAQAAIDAVVQEKIRFTPANWTKIYLQWMDNIEDWCISRQLWWGHRIPIWYDEARRPYVGQDEADVRARHQLPDNIKLKQDEDVLDTWFSSALWPFSSLGWPQSTKEFDTFFPTQVLVTAFDILFFWVARMIMMSLHLTGRVPFRDVYITGLIRDHEGHKMSKSKGNVLDPIDLIDGISLDALLKKRVHGLMQPQFAPQIEKATRKEFPEGIAAYGTDALRFTFCSFASYTREIRFDVNRLLGYRNFCNKLWNASRYVLMNTAGTTLTAPAINAELSLPDRWILSILQETIQAAHQALAQFRFDLFAQVVYEFTWNEFCDWYLELSKPILTMDTFSEQTKSGTRYTLVVVLESLLRLMHPIMPFITEEIWQQVAPLLGEKQKSIMLARFPEANPAKHDAPAEQEINWLKTVIIAIRTLRSEMTVAPGKKLSILLRKGKPEDALFYERHKQTLHTLAKLESSQWLSPDETPASAVSTLAGELEIFIPLPEINKQEELARLQKEKEKLQKDIVFIENKLNNPQFMEKAPPPVVKKEQAQLANLLLALSKREEQIKEIGNAITEINPLNR